MGKSIPRTLLEMPAEIEQGNTSYHSSMAWMKLPGVEALNNITIKCFLTELQLSLTLTR